MRRRHRIRALSLTETERKASLKASGLALEYQKLEELLCNMISPHCRDKELVWQARNQFLGQEERELSRTEINNIITILLEAFDSPTMPPKQVFYIHSMIGLLHLEAGETNLATQSFIKALWVETTMQHPDKADVALTLHRLEVCHQLPAGEGVATVTNNLPEGYKRTARKSRSSQNPPNK
jgi:hypothetical protein